MHIFAKKLFQAFLPFEACPKARKTFDPGGLLCRALRCLPRRTPELLRIIPNSLPVVPRVQVHRFVEMEVFFKQEVTSNQEDTGS